MTEVQVFRLESFDKKKWYETASYTRREGLYPNDRYYTTFPLRNMGHYLRSERWGYGDGGGGREVFTLGYVEMDYNGTVCFRERKGTKMTKTDNCRPQLEGQIATGCSALYCGILIQKIKI
jgi:hypothetical protein